MQKGLTMQEWEHAIIGAKTIGVAIVSGGAAIFGFLLAQTEGIPGDGSLAVILATALISALASMIYLFREDKKRLHELEIKKQEVELQKLKIEADKSNLAAQQRETRESKLMDMATASNKTVSDLHAQLARLQEENSRLNRQLDPLSDSNHHGGQ
jgi:septal ring factor EnvC (AmiA/AmiB activator)